MNDKPNFFKRILLHIPLYRHKAIKGTIDSSQRSEDIINLCNRTISCKIAPQVVQLVADGKFDTSVFEDLEYFKTISTQLFGKKSKAFSIQLKIERVRLANSKVEIRLLITPESGAVGQSAMTAFVYGKGMKPKAYNLENSISKHFFVCEWNDDKHFNYGKVENKKEFVYKILELCKDEMTENADYSTIDLKHRLAAEIGVRFDKLDLYMRLFQRMVSDEMAGINTSGIPKEVDDIEEWMRYVNWEMKQAMARMSDSEIENSKAIFRMMIERDKMLN